MIATLLRNTPVWAGEEGGFEHATPGVGPEDGTAKHFDDAQGTGPSMTGQAGEFSSGTASTIGAIASSASTVAGAR